MTDDGRRWPGTQARRLWRLGGTCWWMTDDGRRWPGTQASRLWRLGGTCWMMADGGRRWPGTQASRLWQLGITCWGPGEGVSHHVVNTRDVDHVAGVLSYVAELSLLAGCPGVGEAAQGKGEGAVVTSTAGKGGLLPGT